MNFYFSNSELTIFVCNKAPEQVCNIRSIIERCNGEIIDVKSVIFPENERCIKIEHTELKDLYGEGATVTLTKINDTCSDICNETFYIPNIEQTG